MDKSDSFQKLPHEILREKHVRNQKLFSSHYLAYRLPERSLWSEMEAGAKEALKQIKDSYQNMAAANLFSAKNEAETERVFLRPTLKALGFEHFSVQPSLDSYNAKLRPDYALFPNRESYRVAQQNREDMRIFYGEAIAVGEAKYWARPMDDRDPSDPVDTSDAIKQIVSYLRDVAEWTDGKTNWGILTNGKLWRLFHRQAGYTAENYVEIDLEAIIQEDNLEAFKYFYTLFSHEAFVIQPAEGISWLESYLKGSEDYSAGITKHLKELIFERVFDGLVQGFVRYHRDKLGITHEDEASKRAIFQGCLTLLYRLLFLLNAESRQLLPMDNADYRQRSLRALMERIWKELDERRDLRYDFEYWHHLERLFKLMNDSVPEFNLPRYNGGLFKCPDPNKPIAQLPEEEIGPWFLENHELADPHLSDAIKQLTFDPGVTTPGARAFIDYSSLGVRHLGEIYEGLLEFKIEIAEDEPVCAVGSRRKPQWKKQSEVTDEDTVHFTKQVSEPYITNDKGERKATGSYYTPHYVVQYIVEHTIGPQLDRFECEKQWHDEISSADADLQDLYDEIMKHTTSENEREQMGMLCKACKNDEERRAFLTNHLDPEWDKHEFDPATRALMLKMLDPAMGSGHFLVHAVDVIADRVADFLNKYPDSPVVKQLEQLRTGILENVREQTVQIDESKLNDVNLIKRMVMKRCIYGVDLNPMAVELAKLSLWLDSFTVGAPLSFLDHHLRCGNSLIGASVEEVRTALEGEKKGPDFHLSLLTSQFTGLMRAVELMQQVGELSDATIPELEESQTRYERAIAHLAPFKALLDIWVSEYFGNDLAREALKQAPEVVEKAVHYLLGRGDYLDSRSEAMLPIVQKTLGISKERRFFHWQLEFPEVWYEGGKSRSNPGFDAVIGNPPYLTTLDRDARQYFFERSRTRGRELDTFYLFIEQSIQLLRQQTWCSMIIPNVFMLQIEAEAFRKYLLQYTIVELSDYGFSVFGESTVPTATFVVYKSPLPDEHTIRVQAPSGEERIIKQAFFSSLPASQFNAQISGILPLLDRTNTISTSLTTYAESHEGVHSGNIRTKLFTRHPTLPCAKKMLKGSDIGRYSLVWGGWYVNYDSCLIDRAKGDYASLREERIFTLPKIWTRQTGDSIIATWDIQGFYSDNTLHSTQLREGIRISPLYLVAALNSRLLTFVYQEWTQERGRTLAQVKIAFLRQLPIRRIFFTTPEVKRTERVKNLQKLYQQGNFDQLLETVETYLPKDNNGEFAVFSRSIPVEQGIEKRSLTEDHAERWALEPGDPSGYDKDGNPLERSDVVHDFLAHLAEQMIEMNKDKRELIERFWTNLEGVTNSETFKKLRKGRQEKTLAKKSEACSAFVNPESGSVKHLDVSLAWSEDAFKGFAKLLAGKIGNLSDLVEVYHKHAPEYKELVGKTEATDKLIDQLVYELYGLTYEEISTVEEVTK